MSAALYHTRLYWVGLRGYAKAQGREVRLGGPPAILGVRPDAVDYVPEVRVAMIMPRHAGWRDMTGEEIADCERALAELVGAEAAAGGTA